MKQVSSSLLLSSPGSFDNQTFTHRIVPRRAKPANQKRKSSLVAQPPATKDGFPGLEGPFRDIGNMLVHLTDAKVEVFDSFVGRRNNKSLEEVCLLIQEFFEQSDRHFFLIYYTGHGINLTGDWVFKDGELTFEMLLALWQNRPQKYDHLLLKEGRQELAREHLVVVSDCCFSGVWVSKAKQYFGSFAPDISIQGACQPGELAWDLGPGEGGCFTSIWLDKKKRRQAMKHRKKLEKLKAKALYKVDKYIKKIKKRVLWGAKRHCNSVSLFFLVVFELHHESEGASLEHVSELLQSTKVNDDDSDSDDSDFSDSSDESEEEEEEEDNDSDDSDSDDEMPGRRRRRMWKPRAPKVRREKVKKPKQEQQDEPPPLPNDDACKKIVGAKAGDYKIVKFLADLFGMMGQETVGNVSPFCQLFHDLDMRRTYVENEKNPGSPMKYILKLDPRVFVMARHIIYFFMMHHAIYRLKHLEKARLSRYMHSVKSALPEPRGFHVGAGDGFLRSLFSKLQGRRSSDDMLPKTPKAGEDDSSSMTSYEAEAQLTSSPPLPCSFLGDAGLAQVESAFNIALGSEEIEVFRSLVESLYDREEKSTCRYWSREEFTAIFCKEFNESSVGKIFFHELLRELSNVVRSI